MTPLIPPDVSHIGELITDINEILELAHKKGCVVYRGKRIAAAFMISMQALFLQREINSKLIYHYKKKENVNTRRTTSSPRS